MASSYLGELVKINILKKETIGRETLYLNPYYRTPSK
ncbi:MAG: hypothetical protein ACKVE3_03250 [Dissulfuribacterales bacterium]